MLEIFFFLGGMASSAPPLATPMTTHLRMCAKWFTVADFHSATKTAAGFTVYAGSPWDITAQR